jgi:hypothetical protein
MSGAGGEEVVGSPRGFGEVLPAEVEVRPGRAVSLLHIPKEDAAVTFFLVHGACATWRQVRGRWVRAANV